MTPFDDSHVTAFTASLKEWDAMTDEERADVASKPHRRDVLGSLDETHKLNRDERGTSELLPLVGFSIAILGTFLALFFRTIGWAIVGGSLLWIGIGIAAAVVAGRGIAKRGGVR